MCRVLKNLVVWFVCFWPVLVSVILGAVLEWRGIISAGTEFLIVMVSLISLYLWYRYFLNTPRSKQLGKYLGL